MPQRRPQPDAISLERKLQGGELPPLADPVQGGVLDRQPDRSHHHVGALPDRRNVEHLPPTEPPIEVLTREEEEAMEAVMEGRSGPLNDEALAPPVNIPFGGEAPPERFQT